MNIEKLKFSNQKLRELRIANNLTQQQLAEAVGINKQTISSYENTNAKPSADVLGKLLAIFGVPDNQLLLYSDN